MIEAEYRKITLGCDLVRVNPHGFGSGSHHFKLNPNPFNRRVMDSTRNPSCAVAYPLHGGHLVVTDVQSKVKCSTIGQEENQIEERRGLRGEKV
jgi:hypothetical protein